MQRSAKVQALVVLGLAAAVWGGWALLGLPIRVRWLVARGAPPATPAASEASAAEIRALGVRARPILLDLFHGSGTRARKSWVASVLLRAPFFDQKVIEAALALPDPPTARAAAFALLEGEEEIPSYEEAASVAGTPPTHRPTPPRPRSEWDPAPAVPVLAAWLEDRSDPEARHAARLLGKVPPGDPRRREALLRTVEEAPEILAADAPPALKARRGALTDSLQSLLPEVRGDPSVAERVAKVIVAVEDRGLTDEGWDVERYALRLLELGRGKGIPPGLLARLAKNPNQILRQVLAGTLESVPGEEATSLLEALAADEVSVIRKRAVYSLMRRKDPAVLRLAPWLAEDSYIYVKADTVKAIDEVRSVDPRGVREMIPFLVACIEDPWPGDGPAPDTPQARMLESGKADIVELAVLALYHLRKACPGFEVGQVEDWKKRAEICRGLVADPAKRKAVVDEWRKTVPAWPQEKRIPALVRRLGEADPENVVRAMRELVRLTGDAAGFPPASLKATGDDTEARNAVREWRKTPGYRETLDRWKAKAGG